MRIITWNVNSLKVRFPHLEILLNEHTPDFLCLQETKTEDKNFLREACIKFPNKIRSSQSNSQ